jgi:hypothetical protein
MFSKTFLANLDGKIREKVGLLPGSVKKMGGFAVKI